ncbi:MULTISPECIES: tetratricopeptide repeat protein [unclassified Agarivorans]|uniref:tetratricopeptide repeat protein n=1 Tax=unclassified Agarivorans TaxID=2636026 RepID=UPI0026E2229D|nr:MULTISPECIES: hypothetical protein [unclassified Agarivorans]MDO6685317.1 hypothetical protein [Agarivorans sp. 3_MG-2023]MDO6715511.1 hypothetical protein [Agarivorans sp. 2_MG-2023]
MINTLWALLALLIAFNLAAQGLSESEARQLKAGQALIQQGELPQATSHLQQLSQQYQQQQRQYALAVSLQYQAQAAIEQQQYSASLNYLLESYQLKQLPESQQQQGLYSIAQLQLQLQQWAKAIDSISSWQNQQAASDVTAESYYWLASAQANLSLWPAASHSIEQALQRQSSPLLSWWELSVALHSQQQHWRKAIEGQLKVLQLDQQNIDAWTQLASLYLHNQQANSALAYLQQAYNKGLFAQPSQFTMLIQLLAQQGEPYQAARLLNTALQQKQLANTLQQQSRLCTLWLQAKEYSLTAPCLTQLIQQQASGTNYQLLAFSQAQLGQLAASISSYQHANQYPDANQAQNYLAQGLLYIELNQLEAAKQVLKKAATFSDTASSSQHALRYIEQRQLH